MIIDLTKGNIKKQIYKFTLPIMATSFINITYGFVDMICVGKLGSGAVAAVGTVGFFIWFANASASMARIGTQVSVSQEYAKKNYQKVKEYFSSAFWINFIFGFVVGLCLTLFNEEVIRYFNLGEKKIIQDAKTYLIIISVSMPFMYSNHILSAMLNSIGNSKLPFIINSSGLIFNIVFDILLIFGIGFFPRLEVFGAGLATAFAQFLVFALLMYFNKKLYNNMSLSFVVPKKQDVSYICKIGFPSALQSSLYCIYSIVLAKIIADFGAIQIAVQKVGSQIESISWMSADGLAVVATAFVGQNFAVEKYDRLKKGIKYIALYSLVLGIFATVALVFYGEQIYEIFINEPISIQEGSDYLRILGYSQLFMSFEILFIGIFAGYGQTRLPSIISIVVTGLRIPIAYFLAKTNLGVDGVWIAISLTSIIKGVLIPFAFYMYNKNFISS